MSNRLFIVAVFSLFASASAIADGLYVGAGISTTQIENDEIDISGVNFDDKPSGWRLLAGYKFSDYVAVEGAYVDSGEADGTIAVFDPFGGSVIDIKGELSTITASLVGTLPLSDSAGLFAKLGYYDADLKANAFSASADANDSGLAVGGGIKFKLGKNFAIRGDLDWYDTDLDTLWSAGLGVEYGFGT